MAEAQITNPRGAFPVSGSTAAQSAFVAKTVAEFKASTTVAANRCVAIGTDYSVATAATDSTAGLTIGISQTAADATTNCDVVIWGLAKAVPVAGTVAAGDVLKRSVTTAGYLSATATPATGEKIAVAIAASASAVADVWVCK